MKRRDIIKNVVAAMIGLTSIAAITGMTIVKNQRRTRSAEELARIREQLQRNGVNGQLPDRINNEREILTAADTATDSPAPAAPQRDLDTTASLLNPPDHLARNHGQLTTGEGY